MGCTLASSARINESRDAIREYNEYGSEDSIMRSFEQKQKKGFALGSGRGHYKEDK